MADLGVLFDTIVIHREYYQLGMWSAIAGSMEYYVRVIQKRKMVNQNTDKECNILIPEKKRAIKNLSVLGVVYLLQVRDKEQKDA